MPARAMAAPAQPDSVMAAIDALAICLALRFLNSQADCAVPIDATTMLRKA